MTASPVVFVVDDDEAVRRSLELLLSAAGLQSRAFATAEAFLAEHDPDSSGCLIVDLQMPGLSGLELQQRLIEEAVSLPTIFLTGHGDVPAAVQALKSGAVDFVQKPYDPETLLAQVEAALARAAEARERAEREASVRERLALLTPREREVLERVAAGSANKVIAIDLDISERTVELHRSRGMRKMEVRSAAALARLLAQE
ncbi:MAG: response regulator transcription factor [Ectothiorhodospiraceae bacterium]|nr:response regulator transcription factor [Chromatiales bacterium]MCP5153773.1 response regulator transcription factor [Ectothiorhodospiraceae bacterium]